MSDVLAISNALGDKLYKYRYVERPSSFRGVRNDGEVVYGIGVERALGKTFIVNALHDEISLTDVMEYSVGEYTGYTSFCGQDIYSSSIMEIELGDGTRHRGSVGYHEGYGDYVISSEGHFYFMDENSLDALDVRLYVLED